MLPVKQLPQQLQSPLAWTESMQTALNPPAPVSPLENGIMEGSPPAAQGDESSVDITCDEVVSALNALMS